MELRQGNGLQTLKEIQKFLKQHPEELPGVSESGAGKKLDRAITELTDFAAAQAGNLIASKSATRTVRALSRSLLEQHMAPIARIAAAELPPMPEMAPLAMPQSRETGERLIALARGMAGEAAKYETAFVDAGLPEDFLEQLEEAADTLAAAVTERKQRQGVRGGATKLLRKRLAEAGKIVKVLDSFVKKATLDRPALRAAWLIVKRHRRQKSAPFAVAEPAGGAK